MYQNQFNVKLINTLLTKSAKIVQRIRHPRVDASHPAHAMMVMRQCKTTFVLSLIALKHRRLMVISASVAPAIPILMVVKTQNAFVILDMKIKRIMVHAVGLYVKRIISLTIIQINVNNVLNTQHKIKVAHIRNTVTVTAILVMSQLRQQPLAHY